MMVTGTDITATLSENVKRIFACGLALICVALQVHIIAAALEARIIEDLAFLVLCTGVVSLMIVIPVATCIQFTPLTQQKVAERIYKKTCVKEESLPLDTAVILIKISSIPPRPARLISIDATTTDGMDYKSCLSSQLERSEYETSIKVESSEDQLHNATEYLFIFC